MVSNLFLLPRFLQQEWKTKKKKPKNVKRERDKTCRLKTDKAYLMLAVWLFCSIRTEPCLMMDSTVLIGFKTIVFSILSKTRLISHEWFFPEDSYCLLLRLNLIKSLLLLDALLLLNLKPSRTWVRTGGVYVEDKRQGTSQLVEWFWQKTLPNCKETWPSEVCGEKGKFGLEWLKDEVRTTAWLETALWEGRETGISYHTRRLLSRTS